MACCCIHALQEKRKKDDLHRMAVYHSPSSLCLFTGISVLMLWVTIPMNQILSAYHGQSQRSRVNLSENVNKDFEFNAAPPIQICNRNAPIAPDIDMEILQRYTSCPLLNNPPEDTTIILLAGFEKYGRTGNNLIEFFHALHYARDKNAVLGITYQSWTAHLITDMWMAVQDSNLTAWAGVIEQSFCVKMIEDDDTLSQYKEVHRMDTHDDVKYLFYYRPEGSFDEYFEYQTYVIRTLWKSYNNGIGLNVRQEAVRDMCSAMQAIFGSEKGSVMFSVVHSRSLEKSGRNLMRMVSKYTGCDPVAALEMEPDYVKAILEPLGMLNRPIVFMTDHQRPDILERLLVDPDIGSNIVLIPSEASWIGGDVTLATVANVFIGNPASSLSAFIHKSRVSLGYKNSYLYLNRVRNGTWVETCDHHCLFW